MKYEGMSWMLLVLGGLVAAFPDYFMRLKSGEPFINNDEHPAMVRLGHVIGITIVAVAAIFLSSHYIF